jgi:acyl-CoA thioesterase FadM
MAVEITTRMLRPCFYDEELLVSVRVAQLGRTSMVMEHALSSVGNDDIRALGRIVVVASDGESSIPWTPGQRAKLEAFEGRVL